MKKGFLGLVLVFILLIGFGVWWSFSKKNEIKSPINERQRADTSVRPYTVVGFLPSFMVGKTMEYTNEIDDLIFLGVEMDEKGNLIWDSQSKKINSEVYLKQKESIKKAGGKNILGIKLFDDEKLNQLMADESAKINLIKQLSLVIKSDGFDGINLDFEYQSSPTSIAGDDFYNFLTSFKKENLGEISVDVFANTILRSDMDNLKRLVNESDNLIVMAYDFHRSGSENAGPVAPINAPAGERNISEIISRITDLDLDKNKIILAYPFYGYEWVTETNEFGSKAKESGVALASYKRMVELLDGQTHRSALTSNYDDLSEMPWLSFEENGEIHQIYYENLKSISKKLELIKNNQLGGVGFWALGYEGENKDVWEAVKLMYN